MPGQRFQFTFSGHSNWVRSCCFSPDGRLAVSGSDDKTVRIWDVATRQCIRVYDDHSGYVNTVAFHPDGTCVASAGTDNAIKVRPVAPSPRQHTSMVLCGSNTRSRVKSTLILHADGRSVSAMLHVLEEAPSAQHEGRDASLSS